MGKAMETKKEILIKLKEGRRTVSQLSGELGLAKSTISQHLAELKGMGAIEEDDNHYFKRLKYYKLKTDDRPEIKPVFNTIWIGAIAVVAAMAVLVAVYALGGIAPNSNSNPQNLGNNSNATSMPAITGATTGTYACPLLRVYPIANYSSVSTIIGYIANASPCYITYINVSSMTINVGSGVKYIPANGTISVPETGYAYTLSAQQRARLENDTKQGYCWAYSTLEAFGINATHPSQCKANIYG